MEEIRKKHKRTCLFHFKPKRVGRLTWECGVWKVPKQNAWAEHNSKQNVWGHGISILSNGISRSNAWACCISNPNAWARSISSQNAQGQRGEAVGIYIRIQKVPYVWVWSQISKQNAPINEVPIVRGPPLRWDKMQVWIESLCFYVFFAMLAGRGSKEGG